MKRTVFGALALAALVGMALSAADYWETKPFATWSDAETQQFLANSPWAHSITVTLPPSVPVTSGAGRGAPATPTTAQVVIAWRSALPMKQALVRSQVGLNGALPAAARELLARKEMNYVVTVDGLPSSLAGSTANLHLDTSIKIGDQPAINPEELLAQPSGDKLVLAFVFPKRPITAQDGEVEFATKVGRVEIRTKFALQDMVFHGQFEM